MSKVETPFPAWNGHYGRMTPSEFTRRVQLLMDRWNDYELDFEDFQMNEEAVGGDHWLSMNMMWLNEDYERSRQ